MTNYNFIKEMTNAVKLKINQDRMFFGNFSVNYKPIPFNFCKGHFLFKS